MTSVSDTTSAALMQRTRALFPGLMASATVAVAATFLSQHYGAPVMLFALLLGMSMNFLPQQGPRPAGSKKHQNLNSPC